LRPREHPTERRGAAFMSKRAAGDGRSIGKSKIAHGCELVGV